MTKRNPRPRPKRARPTRHTKDVNGIEIILLLPCGSRRKRRFVTEAEASEYLKATHATEAPVEFNYSDGSPVTSPAIERIYAPVFDSLSNRQLPPA